MEKGKKIAQNLNLIFKIVQGTFSVAGCVCLIEIIMLFICEKNGGGVQYEFVRHMISQLKIGTVSVNMSSAYDFPAKIYFTQNILILVKEAGWMLFGILGIQIFRNILRVVAETTPFTTEVATGLKKLAWIVLGIGLWDVAWKLLVWILEDRYWHLTDVLMSEKVIGAQVMTNISFAFIPMVFVLFLLSHIFAYGVQLQKESDETL